MHRLRWKLNNHIFLSNNFPCCDLNLSTFWSKIDAKFGTCLTPVKIRAASEISLSQFYEFGAENVEKVMSHLYSYNKNTRVRSDKLQVM